MGHSLIALILTAAQRGALAAVGGRVDSPSKREKLKAPKKAKKTRRVPTVSCTLCWADFGKCTLIHWAGLSVSFNKGAGWLVSTWGVSGEGQYKLTVDSTNDFGKSWSRLSEVDVIPSYEFLGISFIDEIHGQIDLLYFNTTNDRIAFLITMDGGVTWQETGSLLLNQAFWNGNKLEYFDTIEKYVEYNFPKTPHETSYNDRHWKIEFPQGTSEIVVFKKSQSGEWVKVGSFQ